MNDKTSIREFTIDSLKKFYSNLNIPKTGNSKIFYGTCDTAAATTTKVVTCTNFTEDDLVEGVIMLVKFSVTNSGAVANLKLKINNIADSEVPIKKMYATSSTNSAINNLTQPKDITANAVMMFIFTGQYWMVPGLDMNVNSTYSTMSQSEAENGSSTTGRLIAAIRLKETITYWMSKNQSDWYEEDNESPTFIQNKPWYYSNNSIVTDYSISTTDADAIGNESMAIGNNVYSVGDYSIATGEGETTNACIYVEAGSDTITTYELTNTGFQLYEHNLHKGQTIIYNGEFFPIKDIIDEYNVQVNNVLNNESNIEYENVIVILGGISFGTSSHSEGGATSALGNYSHAEGGATSALGDYSHAEGQYNVAAGRQSHAEGFENISQGNTSHAEGFENISHGTNSHVEGNYNFSQGINSHAEGQYKIAAGDASHAEGSGFFITEHLDGLDITGAAGSKIYVANDFPYQFHIGANITYNNITRKIINKGFVGRIYSITLDDTLDQNNDVVISSLDIDYLHGAFGRCSHVEGLSTTAYNICEHAEGQYNVSHSDNDYNDYTIHSVGIGYVNDDSQIFYRNAFEILSNGYIYAYNIGNYDGTNIDSANTLQQTIDGLFVPSYIRNITQSNINRWNQLQTNVLGDWKTSDKQSDSYIYNKPPIDHVFTNVISGEFYPGESDISNYSMQQTSAILAYGSYSFSENNSFALGVNSHSEGYSNVLYKFHDKYIFSGDIYTDIDFSIDKTSYFNTLPIFNYFNANHIPVYILLKDEKHGFCLLREIKNIDFTQDYFLSIYEPFNLLKGNIDECDIYILSYGSLGEISHSEGLNTIALGSYSHSEGSYTIAYHDNEHVCGIYNYWENDIESIFSIGIGVSEQERQTAFTVLKDGTAYLIGVGDFNGHNFLAKSLQFEINNKVNKTELSSQSYITASSLSSQGYLTSESDPIFTASAAHGITSTDITNWNNIVSNVQGDWNISDSNNDAYIKNKPTIPSINGLATEQYVDTAVAGIVNSAPETLDTLNELATALGNDPNFAATIAGQIGEKVSKTELSNQSYVTTTMLSTQGYLTSFTESDPTVPSYVKEITESNITNWNNKANLPSYSSSDAGKILSVNSSGQLVWISPVIIYSGSDAPSNSQGNNGDIYLQS